MPTTKNRGTLSPEVARALATLAERGKPVFSVSEFSDAIGRPRKEVWRLLTFLVERGWITRLIKGQYLIIPLEAGPDGRWTEDSLVLGSRMIAPAAIGYWSACQYWGWTEQVPRTVFVQTTRRVHGAYSRTVLGVQYRFIRLQPGKFFGTVSRRMDRGEISITDPEKTLIDCLDHPELCGGIGQVLDMLPAAEGLQWQQIDRYLERMGSGALYKRLGWLAELLGERLNVPDRARRIEAWRAKLTGGHAPLEPAGPKDGPIDSRWRLRINVPVLAGGKRRR